jgi:nicotinate-nucleotide pyrophosphorylase (carboxylating)
MITGFDLDDFVPHPCRGLGEGGDVTSAATIPAEARFTATMNCREEIVVAGHRDRRRLLPPLDPEVALELRGRGRREGRRRHRADAAGGQGGRC